MTIDLSDKPKGYVHEVSLPIITWKVYLTNGNSYEYTKPYMVLSYTEYSGWSRYNINRDIAMITKPDSPIGINSKVIVCDDGTELNTKYIIAQKEITLEYKYKFTAFIRVVKKQTIFNKVMWTLDIAKTHV